MSEVHWEVTLASTSKASLERFGRALLLSGVKVTASHIYHGSLGRSTSAYVIIKATKTQADRFAEECRPWLMRYASPTYFDNGSIRACHETPDDELMGKPTEHYRLWLLHNGGES